MANNADSLYGPAALEFFNQLENADPGNKICVDCGANRPLWASLSYGSYFCLECSGVHRSLGVHISFVRSLNMDSWSVAQQTKMRAGGNTALKRYLAACGMPESYNKNGTTGSIRDKYHTKAAEAYREHIGKIGRGEPTSLVPVPFEVVVQQVATEKKMAGFGSAPPPREESGLGLGSLVSGISSLTAAAREKASELKDSERARAWKQGIGSGASSLLSAARDAKSRVVEKAQDYASFDAASDLRHLRDGGGDG